MINIHREPSSNDRDQVRQLTRTKLTIFQTVFLIRGWIVSKFVRYFLDVFRENTEVAVSLLGQTSYLENVGDEFVAGGASLAFAANCPPMLNQKDNHPHFTNALASENAIA